VDELNNGTLCAKHNNLIYHRKGRNDTGTKAKPKTKTRRSRR
jgi:hypothetical protein